MLKNAYPFHYIQKEKGDGTCILETHLYRFRSEKSKLVYIVRVERYKYDVYAVKFYLKNHRLSENKYRLLTYTYEPRRIINTCIKIMLSIFKENPNASFGFIGSNNLGENECGTKRYRVYSKLVATYFSDEYFHHKENIGKSAYMLINKNALKNNKDMVRQSEDFFISQYDYFD